MSTLLRNLLTTFSKKSTPKRSPIREVLKKTTDKQIPKQPKKPKLESQEAARKIITLADNEARMIREQAQNEAKNLQASLRGLQDKLQRQQRELDQDQQQISQTKQSLQQKTHEIEESKKEINTIKKKQLDKLEKIAKLSREQAKKILLDSLRKHLTKDIATRIEEAEEKIKETIDDKAKELLVDAMYHGATDYVAEYTISTVKLPNDEVKGRIIGKEGRNIRAFEKSTGVDLDMDETPGEVRLSCYNPVRREIARVALERLIKDGRIQPTRIEEYVAKAKREIDKVVFEEGKKLCHAVGAYNVPRDLIALLGRFKYRSSYGQNMIHHTLEETKIGMKIAAEVNANVDVVKIGCLFHDIGKVIDEEGSHTELGVKLLKKYNVSPSILSTVAEHHEDQEFSSLESIIVYIADAISGSRPGARYENYDEYVKRLTQIEEISKSTSGVREAYAIQAGREVRVIVDPDKLSDKEITKLAYDIKEEIKEKVTYPGTVTVTVIRETRASEIAK